MRGFHGDAAGEADLKCHHRTAPAPRLLLLRDRLFHKLSAKYSEQLVSSNKEHSWVFFVCVGGILLAFPAPLGDLYSAWNRDRLKRRKKTLRKFFWLRIGQRSAQIQLLILPKLGTEQTLDGVSCTQTHVPTQMPFKNDTSLFFFFYSQTGHGEVREGFLSHRALRVDRSWKSGVKLGFNKLYFLAFSFLFWCLCNFADWLSIRSRCPVQLCAVAKINIPNVKSEREGGCGAKALTLLWW